MKCYKNIQIEYENNFKFIFDFDQIFIGKSELNHITEKGGGYGVNFDGNSILIREKNNNDKEYKYIFIGHQILHSTPNTK